jgi:membrane-associated protein
VTDQLLSLLSLYGVAALFGILAISSAGVPFPITLLLVAAGSFVEQGELKLWEVIGFGIAGAVVGDQIGYLIGRWGGREFVDKVTHRFGGAPTVERTEGYIRRRGGLAIFLSRWLITPFGPWVNLISGTSLYPWKRFVLWDVLGETVWVVVYVTLGRIFNDRVQEVAELVGNIAWIFVGVIVSGFLGWKVVSIFRHSGHAEDKIEGVEPAP